jgi:hypothetical protein
MSLLDGTKGGNEMWLEKMITGEGEREGGERKEKSESACVYEA